MSERIRAIRGAITVPIDTADEVTSATRLVLDDMIARNALSPDDMACNIARTRQYRPMKVRSKPIWGPLEMPPWQHDCL